MAQFKGTIKEFTKYIGAYARIKVTSIAIKYRKNKNCCEECGVTSSLEIAHVKGKERPVLIAQILSEFMDETNYIDIDLNEFEQRFINIHLPLESSVRILCTNCHREYDKKIKPEKAFKINNTARTSNQADEESGVIERLVSNQMNKGKALKLARIQHLTTLNNVNTIFSNIIGNQDRWWLEPHNEKFKELLHIILHNHRTGMLYIFQLPANTIAHPETIFKQRNDKYRNDCSDIYITVSSLKFEDKNGFDFTKFLVKKIEY